MKKYFGLCLITMVILLTSCAKPAPMVNLGNVDAYQTTPTSSNFQSITPFQQKLLEKIDSQTNAISSLAQGLQSSVKKPVLATAKIKPEIGVIKAEDIVSTPKPSVVGNNNQRLTTLEKRMTTVERKAAVNSNAVQSVTMRVAELKILSDVSSQHMACIVGNFEIGQSELSDELACKITNKCLPYFKKEAAEKGGDDYRIAYIFGYGDISGRTDATKAFSNARAENTLNFLINNACAGSKTTTAKIVEGGPTKMFGKANFNRCVVIVANVTYNPTMQPQPKQKP